MISCQSAQAFLSVFPQNATEIKNMIDPGEYGVPLSRDSEVL